MRQRPHETRRAAGLTEYAILVVLIAILSISSVRLFGLVVWGGYADATIEIGPMGDENLPETRDPE